MKISLLIKLVKEGQEWVWIIGSCLPAISICVACAAASAFTVAGFGLVGSARATRATCIVGAWLVSLEWIKELALITNELLQLVFVKVISGVKAIVAALALATFDHVGTADKDNWDELEGCIDWVQIVDRIIDLW